MWEFFLSIVIPVPLEDQRLNVNITWIVKTKYLHLLAKCWRDTELTLNVMATFNLTLLIPSRLFIPLSICVSALKAESFGSGCSSALTFFPFPPKFSRKMSILSRMMSTWQQLETSVFFLEAFKGLLWLGLNLLWLKPGTLLEAKKKLG